MDELNWLCTFQYFDDGPCYRIVLPRTFEDLWQNARYTNSPDIDIRDFILNEKAIMCYEVSKVVFNPLYAQYQEDFPSIECVSNILRDFAFRVANKLPEFLKKITGSEIVCLSAIVDEIGAEGNISIVKIIQKSGHSRPVFTALLGKLTKYNVAEVKNQGTKGTYIKLLQPIYFIMNDKDIAEGVCSSKLEGFAQIEGKDGYWIKEIV